MSISVVFHKNYNATIGDDHKFPINKFSELAAYLEKKNIVKEFFEPYPCSDETLKRVHAESYIKFSDCALVPLPAKMMLMTCYRKCNCQ